MAKLSFNKLNLKRNAEVKIVSFGENEIEVKQYLPMEEKISLVELVVQESMEYGFVNPLKMEKYFNLYFTYKYTNINFTDKVREDEDALYDLLEENGIFDLVTQASERDYVYLFERCEEYLNKYERYQNSFYGMATKIVNDIPENMAQATKALESLDFEKISDTMKMISANGGNQEAITNMLNGQK